MGILWNQKKKINLKTNPKSILVIQTAFIGDVILATSLLESLRSIFPAASIDFLLRKGNQNLLEKDPRLRKVLVLDKSEKYKSLIRVISDIRSARYDLLVNLQRFTTTGIVTILSGAKYTIGFNKNPLSLLFDHRVKHEIGEEGTNLHEIDRNHHLINSLTELGPAKPKLFIPDSASDKIKNYTGKPYICIAPASVWFTKQYPASGWVSLINSLPSDLTIYLLGAASEYQLAAQIVSGCEGHSEVINLAGELNLLESAALMKQAKLVYTNDSAPMHLASAVNAPVCAVYCSTIPAFGFGPLSDFARIVEVDSPLYCKPCGLHGYKSCPEGHFKCAKDIKTKQLTDVWELIQNRSESV